MVAGRCLSSIKAVPAVALTRPKPPTAAIGGWLPRKAERGFEFLKSLAAVLLSLLLMLSPTHLGDHDLGILREQIDTLAEKENLPLGSEEQDAWVNAIMEEQAARSARSRRKAIEDFHCVCGG